MTKIAYAMVTYYGMSKKVGNLSFYDAGGSYEFTKPYSETRAQTIDSEVQDIIDSQYARARDILEQYTDGHHQLAQLLLEREVIYTEDAERIFGKRKWLSRTEEIMRVNEQNKAKEQEVQAEDNAHVNGDDEVTPPPFNHND